MGIGSSITYKLLRHELSHFWFLTIVSKLDSYLYSVLVVSLFVIGREQLGSRAIRRAFTLLARLVPSVMELFVFLRD